MKRTLYWPFIFCVALSRIAHASCPSNSLGATGSTASPSTVYGYHSSDATTDCRFKTLEEAEGFASGSVPLISIAFPIVGSLDQPTQNSGTLDYRQNGALGASSPILQFAPQSVTSSYAAYVTGWPPTSLSQLDSSCRALSCTTGWCGSMSEEATRLQCQFNATWKYSSLHPGWCWQGGTLSSTSSFGGTHPVVTGSGASGVLTYRPSSSSSNDSGGQVTISGATACNNNTTESENPAVMITTQGKEISNAGSPIVSDERLKNAEKITPSAKSPSVAAAQETGGFSWGGQQQNTFTCPNGSSVNGSATSMGNACSSGLTKVDITPPNQFDNPNQCGVGDPCFPGNGNQQVTEPGFQYGYINFELYYNSVRQTRPYAYVDRNWSHSFAKRILSGWSAPSHIVGPDESTIGNVPRITVQDEKATVETYLQTPLGSGIFRSTSSEGRILVWYAQVGSAPPFYELYYPDGYIEVYDRAGRLTRVIDRDNPQRTLAITYLATFNYAGTSGENGDTAHFGEPFWRVAQVIDGSGRSASFVYTNDSYYWLVQINGDDGLSLLHLDYTNSDGVHRLTSTTSRAAKTRTFNYNESGSVAVTGVTGYWLTSIKDELQQSYAHFSYDDWGRIVQQQFGSGANTASITYSSDTAVSATRQSGEAQTYQFPATEPYRQTTGMTNLSGTVESLQYDDTHGSSSTYRPKSITDSNGNQTVIQFDASAIHVVTRTEANGKPEQRRVETDWDYGLNRRLARRLFDINGLVTEEAWTYNAQGQISNHCTYDPQKYTPQTYLCGSATNAPAGVRQYSIFYCSAVGVGCPFVNMLQQVNGPRRTDDAGMGSNDDIVTYMYYTNAAQSYGCGTFVGPCYHTGDLYQVKDALGRITTILTYDTMGDVVRYRDPNGVYVDLTYDALGQPTSRTIRANNDGTANTSLDATTQVAYDDARNMSQVTFPDGTFFKFGYDTAHRLTDIWDSASSFRDHMKFTLDDAGHQTVEQIYDPQGNLRKKVLRFYDQYQHLRALQNSSGSSIETHQNPPELPTAGYYANGYDGAGNDIYSIDSNGVATKRTFDGLNRIVGILRDHAGSTSTTNAPTNYSYDVRNNLTQIADADAVASTFGFDGLNNLISAASLDTGTTTFSFDTAGNRTSRVDARNITTTYRYDALNRLIAQSYPTASLNVAFNYDEPNATTGCTTSYPLGRLTTMIDASGKTVFCYDIRGNVLNKQQTAGGVTLTTTFAYTLADALKTITYPSGLIVDYSSRDAVGRVNAISYKSNASAAPANLLNSISYYPFGPPNILTFGNNRTLTKTYNQDYFYSSVSSSDPNGLSIGYATDVLGNVTSASAVPASGPTVLYGYDSLYRLTTQSSASSGTQMFAATYSPGGDRLSATTDGAAQSYSISPGTHHLQSTTSGSFINSFDPNGNLTYEVQTSSGYPNITRTYDDANRMATAHFAIVPPSRGFQGLSASVTYGYNGRGERVRKTLTNFGPGPSPQNSIFVYDEAEHLVGEYSAVDGSVISEYIYASGLPVGFSNGGQIYYVETDLAGTPRNVVKPGASTAQDVSVWNWNYFASAAAFGASPVNADPSNLGSYLPFNLRFPGQYSENESTLFYNMHRYYEPGVGGYTQSDPLSHRSALNPYAYVDGNPLTFVDTLGLDKRCFENWSKEFYDAMDAGKSKQIDIKLSTIILPDPHPEWGIPSPGNPLKQTPIDAMGFYFDLVELTHWEHDVQRQWDTFEKGTWDCTYWDGCNHPTGHTSDPISRMVNQEWRTEDKEYSWTSKIIGRLHTVNVF